MLTRGGITGQPLPHGRGSAYSLDDCSALSEIRLLCLHAIAPESQALAYPHHTAHRAATVRERLAHFGTVAFRRIGSPPQTARPRPLGVRGIRSLCADCGRYRTRSWRASHQGPSSVGPNRARIFTGFSPWISSAFVVAQGLKPLVNRRLTAQLKPCPDTPPLWPSPVLERTNWHWAASPPHTAVVQ